MLESLIGSPAVLQQQSEETQDSEKRKAEDHCDGEDRRTKEADSSKRITLGEVGRHRPAQPADRRVRR